MQTDSNVCRPAPGMRGSSALRGRTVMSRAYRLGIVGAGLVATSSHIPAALSLPDVDISALVDPSTLRAQQIASRYQVRPLIVADLPSALDRVDGVVIAAPND